MPVRNRIGMVSRIPPAKTAIAAVQTAPATAQSRNNFRGFSMSERFNTTETSEPIANPNWTDILSQACEAPVRFHSRVKAGRMAVALNHSPMASSSAVDSSASARLAAEAPTASVGCDSSRLINMFYDGPCRSEENTSELQSPYVISY